MTRYYEISVNGLTTALNRKSYEAWLKALVAKYNLTGDEFSTLATGVSPDRCIEHHPLRVGKQIGQKFDFTVSTYEK
jgi:hypothetical protein